MELDDKANEEWRIASCVGKEVFESPSLARRIAVRRSQRGRTSEAYRCKYCNMWHVGKPKPKPRKLRRK